LSFQDRSDGDVLHIPPIPREECGERPLVRGLSSSIVGSARDAVSLRRAPRSSLAPRDALRPGHRAPDLQAAWRTRVPCGECRSVVAGQPLRDSEVARRVGLERRRCTTVVAGRLRRSRGGRLRWSGRGARCRGGGLSVAAWLPTNH